VATIVQNYGPIYGEVVNGTVQGRPNGSVYVPLSNKIELSTSLSPPIYIRLSNDRTQIYTCNDSGVPIQRSFKAVADAQDLASYIRLEVGTTNTFTTVVGRNLAAGMFNLTIERFANDVDEDEFPIDNGETYYLRAILMSSTNEPVAVSDVFEATGWSA
jgi:hypothetical protein